MDWLIDRKHLERSQLTAWAKEWREPFDLVALRISLEALALSRDQFESTLGEAQKLQEQRGNASDTEAAWAVTHLAAMQHASQHGVPADSPRALGQPACGVWPCKACGVSFALLELHEFYAEATSTPARLADDLAEFARRLRSLNRFGAQLIARLHEEATRNGVLASKVMLQDFEWRRWVAGLSIIGLMDGPFLTLQGDLRAQFRSAGVRYATPGKPGRPHRGLLAAVAQHLAKGGFDEEDIVVLIPDDSPGKGSQAEERVRKRVADQDCRTLIPWEPAPPKSPE